MNVLLDQCSVDESALDESVLDESAPTLYEISNKLLRLGVRVTLGSPVLNGRGETYLEI